MYPLVPRFRIPAHSPVYACHVIVHGPLPLADWSCAGVRELEVSQETPVGVSVGVWKKR